MMDIYKAMSCTYSMDFKLPELETFGRESRRGMLNVTGMNRPYYLKNVHGMRCKYDWIHCIQLRVNGITSLALFEEVFL